MKRRRECWRLSAIVLVLLTATGNAQIAFTNTGQRLDTTNCAWEIQLADLNGDGALDAYFNATIWTNNSQGRFTRTAPSFGPAGYPAWFGDIDGDGWVDVVCNNVIYRNDGHFGFSQTNRIPSDIPMLKAVLTDLTGDGRLDLITASQYTDRVLLNDGLGGFTNTQFSLGGWGQSSYALGDINGDGFTDIYVGIPHTPPPNMVHATNLIWLGDGHGHFTSRTHNVANALTRAAVLADFNRDGRLDLFLGDQGDWGNYSKVFFNDGNGNFTNSNQNLGASIRDADGLDLNNDGLTDLLLSRGPFGASSWPSTVWTNNGAGRFADSGLRLGSASTVLAACADVNGDGQSDVLEIHVLDPITASAYTEVWLNSSRFRPFIRTHPTNQTGLPGGNVRFDAFATGETPLACQWEFNAVHLPSATNGFLLLSNVQLADTGSYRVIVTNALGAATSNPALLLADPNHLRLSSAAPGALSFQCWQGTAFETEYSTNLTNWTFLVSLTNVSGTLDYFDAASGQCPVRFYRSVIR